MSADQADRKNAGGSRRPRARPLPVFGQLEDPGAGLRFDLACSLMATDAHNPSGTPPEPSPRVKSPWPLTSAGGCTKQTSWQNSSDHRNGPLRIPGRASLPTRTCLRRVDRARRSDGADRGTASASGHQKRQRCTSKRSSPSPTPAPPSCDAVRQGYLPE
jgi:hypothetical protein